LSYLYTQSAIISFVVFWMVLFIDIRNIYLYIHINIDKVTLPPHHLHQLKKQLEACYYTHIYDFFSAVFFVSCKYTHTLIENVCDVVFWWKFLFFWWVCMYVLFVSMIRIVRETEKRSLHEYSKYLLSVCSTI